MNTQISKSTKVTTYWQPKGHSYNVVDNTTIENGLKYGCEWAIRAMKGEMVMIFDHTNDGSPNPGIETVIVNPTK